MKVILIGIALFSAWACWHCAGKAFDEHRDLLGLAMVAGVWLFLGDAAKVCREN